VAELNALYIMLLLMRVMVNVPFWLVQPMVWPVSVKVPLPEPMPLAIVPFITSVFVEVLPEGVHDMVILMSPPFIIPAPIWPFITVPAAKQGPRVPMLPKFMLLPFSIVLFCVMLNVKEPNCWAETVAKVADQVPVPGFVGVVVDEELLDPPQATRLIASATALKKERYLIRASRDFI
jgi:hypothetical protein